MARQIPYKVAGSIQLPEKTAKQWFGVIEVGEQGKTRIRVSKRDVTHFRGISGERLDQLQLPSFKTK